MGVEDPPADCVVHVVGGLFARRIFGPDRDALLATSNADEPAAEDPAAARAAALRTKIKYLEREQANVVTELREHQPTGDHAIDQQWRHQLRQTFAEITTQRKDMESQLADITVRPEPPTNSDPRLLYG